MTDLRTLFAAHIDTVCEHAEKALNLAAEHEARYDGIVFHAGSQGYYQSGPEIFCRNCSAAIFTPTIGVTGGCNPVPLPSEEVGTDLIIQVSDLLPGAGRFAGAAHE